MFESLTQWLHRTTGIESYGTIRLLESAAVIVALSLLRLLVLQIALNKDTELKTRYTWRKGTQYLVYALGLILLAQIWIGRVTSLATFLGLVSAGLAVALKDPLVNLAGWMFLLWRRPFEVGDRIELNGLRGDVIDIRLFEFSVMEVAGWVRADQSTGRIVHIPNGKCFTEQIINYTESSNFIWSDLSVVITFESDWQKAKKILTDILIQDDQEYIEQAEKELKAATKRFLLHFKNLTPIVYTFVVDHGVRLDMRFLVPVRQRRAVEERVWEDVLKAFAAAPDIDFAYPTTRIYRHPADYPTQTIHPTDITGLKPPSQ